MKIKTLLVFTFFAALFSGCANKEAKCVLESSKVSLENGEISLVWHKGKRGWELGEFSLNGKSFGTPSGMYTLIKSKERPDSENGTEVISDGKIVDFPEKNFVYCIKRYNSATSPVAMNRAGESISFWPDNVSKTADGKLIFSRNTAYGLFEATWSLDKNNPRDILVETKFTPNDKAYYSVSSPDLAELKEEDLSWGIVPGWFQGDGINKNFVHAYVYAQGLPEYPVITRDDTTTTMASILESRSGVSLGVIVEPGQARDPYPKDKPAHSAWKVGLSHMTRSGRLSPTAYYPVLGQVDSLTDAGQTRAFKLRYTLGSEGYFDIYKHAVEDIYKLGDTLSLKDAKVSLSERILNMRSYIMNDSESYWKVVDYEGKKIGAQGFSPKIGKRGEMKNTDIGAAWMLGFTSGDNDVKNRRLQYMRNFKFAQQDTSEGFFKGAARGQYFICSQNRFIEEYHDHYEPIGLTYYTIIDLGNIMLFEPEDREIKELLRLGADRLLEWQKPDGSWEVAYDTNTRNPVFKDIKDLRPTFYGMYVAYRILGDKKYLDAAERGADWIIENAVNPAHFIGVCGDHRFVNDFATAQVGQGLLDMYELTGKKKYLDAAVKAARLYTFSVYTHPIDSRAPRIYHGNPVEEWQLSQVGLSFEHGGAMGSARGGGPINLATHAGYFVRIYDITKDKIFLDMARHAALAKDCFVSPQQVYSYYWANFDRKLDFPNHVWWQIGWITDYLLSEAQMRSGGKIYFPRGFFTPKVGPQKCFGFKPGKVLGQEANIIIKQGLLETSSPNADYLCAVSKDGKKLFAIILNSSAHKLDTQIKIDASVLGWKNISSKDVAINNNRFGVSLEPFGIKIVEIQRVD